MQYLFGVVIGISVLGIWITVSADTAVITNTVSSEASSGSGGGASATVTTSVNGNTTRVEVSGGDSAAAQVKTSNMGTAPTQQAVRVEAKGGASVSVTDDTVSVTIQPSAANGASKAATVSFSKSDLIKDIVIVDADGDGSPDAIESIGGATPVSLIVDAKKMRTVSSDAARGALEGAVYDPIAVASIEDLTLFSARAVFDDERIAHVAFEKGDMVIEYHEKGRLLGIVPVALRTEVVAGSDGRVSLQFPWWHIFIKKPWGVAEVEQQVAVSVQERADAFQGLDLLPRQALMYQTVTNVMKTRHDTVKNSIQNIR